MPPQSSEQFNFRGIAILFIVLVVLSFLIDINSLKNLVVEAGIWSPIIFILLKVLTIIIAPISGGPLYPLVGLFFGFWPGIAYVALGDFIGYSLAFIIARKFGHKAVKRFIAKNEDGTMSKIVRHIGTGKGFFHACLAFFALPELLSYAAGLSTISYGKFISILWPASVVAAGTLVFLGSTFDMSDKPLFITLLVPLVGTTCVIVGGLLFMKELKDKK